MRSAPVWAALIVLVSINHVAAQEQEAPDVFIDATGFVGFERTPNVRVGDASRQRPRRERDGWRRRLRGRHVPGAPREPPARRCIPRPRRIELFGAIGLRVLLGGTHATPVESRGGSAPRTERGRTDRLSHREALPRPPRLSRGRGIHLAAVQHRPANIPWLFSNNHSARVLRGLPITGRADPVTDWTH